MCVVCKWNDGGAWGRAGGGGAGDRPQGIGPKG